uniref:Uncharacterized protein n=1 Tax=Physcomitrium patens TaxID=3218 RepID=A0A7I4CC44_PHYPA
MGSSGKHSPIILVLIAALLLSCGSFWARAEADNVITQWHFAAQRVVRTLGVPSQIASRTYTLLHVSQYKALQLAYKIGASHPEAAAAYAGHYVLSEIFPTQQSTSFDGLIDKQITPLELTEEEDAAIRKIGLQFAKSLLKKRTHDGSQQWIKFVPSPAGGPTGKYQFTSNQTFVLYPQLGKTRPFVIKSVAKFNTNGGPYAIPSSKYNTDYEEIATVGNVNSSSFTDFFKETAKFWEAGANTSTVNGQLFNATLAVVKDISVKDLAKLFAKISVAQYDSSIAGWQQKFKYLHWRPITALRCDIQIPPRYYSTFCCCLEWSITSIIKQWVRDSSSKGLWNKDIGTETSESIATVRA